MTIPEPHPATPPTYGSELTAHLSMQSGATRLLRRRYLVLGAILLLALVLRCWGLAWGLHDANISRRPHPDEWAIYWLFQWFDAKRSLNPCPSSPGQCFLDWGSVFPYLAYAMRFALSPLFDLIPANAFGSHADPTFVRAILSARILSAALSTATVAVVYRVGSLSYGTVAGLLAALIVALSGLLIELAHFATPDATQGFLLCSALLAMALAMRDGSPHRFLLAGVLVGLAAGTEFHMALLAVPLGCAWLLADRRDARSLLMAVGAAIAAYAASNPYALLDFHAFRLALEHAVRVRTIDSSLQYQDRWAPYGPGWLYVIRYPLGYGVGFALSAWFVAGVAWSMWCRHRHDVLLLSWLVPYFLLVSLSPAKFMRYSAPLMPPLAILTARFMVVALSRYPRRATRSENRGVPWLNLRRPYLWSAYSLLQCRAANVIAALTVGVSLAFSGVYDAAYAGLFAAPDPRLVATTWLTNHLQPGEQVEFEELPNGLVNLPVFVTESGYRPCFALFRLDRLDSSVRYLALDSYALEDHDIVSGSVVRHFRQDLRENSDYRIAFRVAYVPTFLGLRFPIGGSPHDWRYPDHEITVYRRVVPVAAATAGGSVKSLGGNCYRNLQAATASLYVAPQRE